MEKQLEEAKFIAEDTDRKYDEVTPSTRFDVTQSAQELCADFEAGCLVNLLIISQGLLWRVALLDWLLYEPFSIIMVLVLGLKSRVLEA